MLEFFDVLVLNSISELIFIQSEKVGKIEMSGIEESAASLTGEIIVSKEKGESANILQVYTADLIKPKRIKTSLFQIDNLKKVNFNGVVDFSMIETTTGLFSYCSDLEEVDFGNTKFTNLKSSENMFYCCKKLKHIKGFTLNCPKLTSTSRMFYKCNSLREISFENWYIPNLEYAIAMFYKCVEIKKIDMESISLTKIRKLHSCFQSCENLETITIKKISGIETANHMFDGCKKLKNININFNYKNLVDAEYMFYDCKSLKFFDFSRFNPEDLHKINAMFANCISLKGAAVFPYFKFTGEHADNVFSGCTQLKKIDMSNVEFENVEYFLSFATKCKKLESIEFGTAHTVDGYPVSFSGFVSGCSNLRYLNLEKVTIKEISCLELAANCTSLKVVKLGFGLGNLSNNDRMFQNCSELNILQYPDSQPTLIREPVKNIFNECKNIKALNLTGLNMDKLVNPKDLFQENIKLLYVNKSDVDIVEEYIPDRTVVQGI